jgi:UTP--glucose-1-phosphate uridylyltransferase
MNIKKVVVTAAGLGTRLLSVTKEMPKEMLPLFCIGSNGGLSLKPVLQLIFEQLYDVDFRAFCFIVGARYIQFVNQTSYRLSFGAGRLVVNN